MKYLHAVLTVIAVCLVLITLAVTGVLPAAHARESNPRFVSVPVNADGSINVKIVKAQTMDVNIKEVNGSNVWGSALPITSSSPLDVNVKYIGGSGATVPLSVRVDR
ncbi:hypothetical protein [Niastella sp. OAS944]|uniref:hypothetical protein n=1 Tax=Niastella sp. OAS944 TaxID=2664089 RepID=UPI00347B22AE|nr:hypothetical protein [Chitinophagaceae bacterium OAS944]